MSTLELLKKLILEIAESDNQFLNIRGGPSGMNGGAGHPIIKRKPLMGFGKSEYEDEKPKKKKKKKKPVKISKAFDLDEIDEYEKILEGLIKCKKLT